MADLMKLVDDLVDARDEMRAAEAKYEAKFKLVFEAGVGNAYLAKRLGLTPTAVRSFSQRRGWS